MAQGNLRNYMSDIARSDNSSSSGGGGGGETIDVSYFYDKANIASITLLGVDGKENAIESFEIDENTTSITPTTVDKSTIFGARITYKNNLMFGNSSGDGNFNIIKTIEYNDSFSTGGYVIQHSISANKITCYYLEPGLSGSNLWEISIL